MSRKKKTDVAPQITDAVTVNGTHLTVTKYPNGTADLVWDWEALLAEVQAATISAKQDLVSITEERVKKARSKKVIDTVVEVVKTTAKKVKKAVENVVEKPAKQTRKKKGE